MMDNFIGTKHNRWTVKSFSRSSAGKHFFLCRCECGTKRVVRKDQLTRGISKSCGCWKAEVATAQVKRLFTTHGLSNKSRAYSIWKGMRRRCYAKAHHNYPEYGGRGISICERWHDFANFLTDMGEPAEGQSIDRIDVNGNYEPSNCRWADTFTQMNNMRTNFIVRYKGETMTLKQWSRKLQIPYHRLYQRIFKLSWSVDKAFTTGLKVNQFG